MKQQLLFLIDTMGCGGAEKSLISLLPLIDASRYDIDLIIMDPEHDKEVGVFEKYIAKTVNVIDFRLFGTSLIEKFRKFCYYARLSPQLRLNQHRHGAEVHWRSAHFDYKILDKDYDVAIAYQQGVPTFFLATKVHAKKKIAWINVDVYEAGYDMEYCRRFYDRMDHIVAVSDKLQNKLLERSPWMKDKLVTIYDIVNQDVIRLMSDEPVRDMLRQDGVVSIVTTGRLVPQKNYLLAVEAARILKNNQINFKWFFVGEGSDRNKIERSISDLDLVDDVKLLGFKDNPYPYMANADIYVQTSSFEGFGLTVAEAKILHCPIVSTNFDVVYDQIIDHQNGLIAEMTPESVASEILELLQNEELRCNIVSNLEQETNTTSITEVEKFHALIGNE